MESWLTFCLSLLLVSCGQKEWYKKEIPEEDHTALAHQLMVGGAEYQGSVAEQFRLEEAMRYDTNSAALWRELGTARVKRGLANEMEYYYGKAVEKDAQRWVGFRGYLYLYFYRDFPRAIADFDYSDQLMGEVGFSQGQNHNYMRGIAYYGLQEYEKSLESLDSYINLTIEQEGEDWVDVNAFLYRAIVLQALGKIDNAYQEYDRVLTYFSNSSDALFHQAEIKFQKGDFSGALDKLSQARENFNKGYYHQRPYVEVLEQIYIQDLKELEVLILKAASPEAPK